VIRLLADENLNYNIVRGLRRRLPEIDIVRVQDVGLTGADDPSLLAWAAGERRVVISHDAQTLATYAHDRANASLQMPGVIEISFRVSVRVAIEDLLLIAECSLPDEWEGKVLYLPL
jgi:predicted nuclease of predicted toxin-antitoxin system